MTDWRYVESECKACGGSSPENITVPPGPCVCRGTGKVGVLVAGPVTVAEMRECFPELSMSLRYDAAPYRPTNTDIKTYLPWRWQRDLEPCQDCDGGKHGRRGSPCPDCGGAGRTLVVDCDACNGHGKVTQHGDGFATCEPCKGLGSFVVIGYRQATKLETRRECRGCPGDGLRNEIGAHCLHCNDKGYIDAEPGELWIAAEVLR